MLTLALGVCLNGGSGLPEHLLEHSLVCLRRQDDLGLQDNGVALQLVESEDVAGTLVTVDLGKGVNTKMS